MLRLTSSIPLGGNRLADTRGPVNATSPCSCDDHARAFLLGSTRPDPLYRDADIRFDGWALAGGRDLTWFGARAAVPYRVVLPLTTPIRNGEGGQSRIR